MKLELQQSICFFRASIEHSALETCLFCCGSFQIMNMRTLAVTEAAVARRKDFGGDLAGNDQWFVVWESKTECRSNKIVEEEAHYKCQGVWTKVEEELAEDVEYNCPRMRWREHPGPHRGTHNNKQQGENEERDNQPLFPTNLVDRAYHDQATN